MLTISAIYQLGYILKNFHDINLEYLYVTLRSQYHIGKYSIFLKCAEENYFL